MKAKEEVLVDLLCQVSLDRPAETPVTIERFRSLTTTNKQTNKQNKQTNKQNKQTNKQHIVVIN
jgi:hypothetical protein